MRNVFSQSGDLHARYGARIRRHVYAVMGGDDERDDVLQDVLMTAIQKVGALRDPACIDVWVARVTASTISNFLRRRRFRRHTAWETLPEGERPTVDGDLDARNLASRAVHFIERLPAEERTLLTKYWFTHATIESMAAEVGCSRMTMRRRLTRARDDFEKLARRDPELAPYFDDPTTWWGRFRPHRA